MLQDKPLRSVLYVPADRERALAKIPSLDCDAVIIDLEDSVAPGAKAAARETMRGVLADKGWRAALGGRVVMIRINALSGPDGTEDLLAARGARPDAIVLPKVDVPADIAVAEAALAETDAPASLGLVAMIETAAGALGVAAIAAAARNGGRLSGLILGLNDLALETGMDLSADRRPVHPVMTATVLAARAAGIAALDGVFNRFADADGFAAQCAEARAFGFDGKTLIHPGQIAGANSAFSPGAEALARAEAIVRAYADPQNADAGAIAIDGTMVERLHLREAGRLLAKARMIGGRNR